jgi:hypothetical protein
LAASSTAQAAIVAALKGKGDASAMPLLNHRKSIGSRKTTESHSMNARPNMHSYFERSSSGPGPDSEALEDNSLDEDQSSSKDLNTKSRNRRASEGSYLIKGEGKKSSSELRCDTCGKGYKHSSCLTKHLYDDVEMPFSVHALIATGGSMIPRGQSHPNSLFQSISRFNFWKRHRFYAT